MWELIGALGSAVGGYLSSREQRKAAEQASQAQLAAVNAGLGFQQQALDRTLGQQQSQFGQAIGLQQQGLDRGLGQLNQALGLQQQGLDRGLNAQQGQLDQALGFQREQLGAARGFGQSQLGALESLFAPYTQAGQQALGGLNQYAQGGLAAFQQQQALSGALGADAQRQAIAGLENSPAFAALAKQGEDAILQNASATGGLRGGNTQAALAQFRPALLNQQIQQQFANLGGLSALGAQNLNTLGQFGQASAAGQAQGGLGVLQAQLGLTGQLAGNAASLYNQAAGNSASLFGQFGNNAAGLASTAANLFGQSGNTQANLASQFGLNAANASNANTAAVAALLGQQGDAISGNALAQGQAGANLFGGIGGAINQAALLRMLASRGGIPRPAAQSTDATQQSLLGLLGGVGSRVFGGA